MNCAKRRSWKPWSDVPAACRPPEPADAAAGRGAHGTGARRLCGMHWGTIQLTDEPPFEPPVRFRAAAVAAGYAEDDAWALAIGETRMLPAGPNG